MIFGYSEGCLFNSYSTIENMASVQCPYFPLFVVWLVEILR